MSKRIFVMLREGYDFSLPMPEHDYTITTEGVVIFKTVTPSGGLITMAPTKDVVAFYPHANLISLQIVEA